MGGAARQQFELDRADAATDFEDRAIVDPQAGEMLDHAAFRSGRPAAPVASGEIPGESRVEDILVARPAGIAAVGHGPSMHPDQPEAEPLR
ncbi:hypothetical protein GCM10010932_29920 [Agromyces flavus]|nr:hypothetical protein GCM10010932_29920 [Agromyces flavus]